MSTQNAERKSYGLPSFFGNTDEFFKPWNEWFTGAGVMKTFPAVNITENKGDYEVALAAPGMKKDDFKIDLAGNILTVSSEKEETKEDKDKKFTRQEYSYSSFTRSFTLPEGVNKENIDASYQDGVLKLVLPKKKEAKNPAAKQITVK
jgi:HSP20 family protein